MKSPIRLALIAAWGTLATGCASSLSGVGGTQTYACKAPEGVLCTSVAGVYANSVQNNLPSQRTDARPEKPMAATANRAPAAPAPASGLSAAIPGSASDAASIRSAPRVLRVWLAPWEDSDGDLQDQSYLYVVVDAGHWLIDHQRALIRRPYAAIAAPTPTPGTDSEAMELSPSTTLSLPRPGAASSIPSQARQDDIDAEHTVR